MNLHELCDLVTANAINLVGYVVIHDDHIAFNISEMYLSKVRARVHPDGRIHETCCDFNSSILYTVDEYASFLRCEDEGIYAGETWDEGRDDCCVQFLKHETKR